MQTIVDRILNAPASVVYALVIAVAVVVAALVVWIVRRRAAERRMETGPSDRG